MKVKPKNKGRVFSIWGLLGLVVLIAVFAFRPVEKYFEIAKSLDIFSTLFKEVNIFYVDEVEPKKLIDKGIAEMLNTLDPYTDYIPEESAESFSIQTTGQYAGVGALIGLVNKKTVIRQTYIGFPAHNAGVKVGDELILIDGKNVQGKSSGEVSGLLKGAPKSEVLIVVKRSGVDKEMEFKIVREKIKVSNVVCQEMVGNAGYIKLDDFTPGATKEVEEAIEKFKKQRAKGIILDLRENPGGLLFEAINIVNLFIPKGVAVVSTKGKVEDWNKTYNTLSQPIDTTTPIIVLVGSGSASASEIVAGALQDYDRAVLIGEKTFGKGLVQTTRKLPYNAQLKVTTAKYYIPSGRCIQAMDYTHRKSDGTVSKVADSLKVAFKTKNGRTVYDGGGLDPDIKIIQDQNIPVLEELNGEDYFFEYANLYCAKQNPPTDLKKFTITDKDYLDFVEWLKNGNFKYTSALEAQINVLAKVAKEEKQNEDVLTAIQNLNSRIGQAKQNDLMKFKNKIINALEQEIAFHWSLHGGRFQVSSDSDNELQKAIQLINDPQLYKKNLSPL